jgi:hypothetical protein
VFWRAAGGRAFVEGIAGQLWRQVFPPHASNGSNAAQERAAGVIAALTLSLSVAVVYHELLADRHQEITFTGSNPSSASIACLFPARRPLPLLNRAGN